MSRRRMQIGGELLVLLVLGLVSGQWAWVFVVGAVVLPGLRSVWRHPMRTSSST